MGEFTVKLKGLPRSRDMDSLDCIEHLIRKHRAHEYGELERIRSDIKILSWLLAEVISDDTMIKIMAGQAEVAKITVKKGVKDD